MKRNHDRHRGIALVDLLIALGVVVALLAVLLVALGPRTRARKARNDLRILHVRALSDAVQVYAARHGGALPEALSGLPQGQAFVLTTSRAYVQGSCPGSGSEELGGTIDLQAELIGEHLEALPVDPAGDVSLAGYYVRRTPGGRLEIGACHPEDEGAGFEPIVFRR